jgi:dynein heavy chain
LNVWLAGLQRRHTQLNEWLISGRPASFWMAGFFNPAGFLTAFKQELVRRNKENKEPWSLGGVELNAVDIFPGDTELKYKYYKDRKGSDLENTIDIKELYLEGAQWSKNKTLVELTNARSEPIMVNLRLRGSMATKKSVNLKVCSCFCFVSCLAACVCFCFSIDSHFLSPPFLSLFSVARRTRAQPLLLSHLHHP